MQPAAKAQKWTRFARPHAKPATALGFRQPQRHGRGCNTTVLSSAKLASAPPLQPPIKHLSRGPKSSSKFGGTFLESKPTLAAMAPDEA